jgi:putative membrane protein (TIGR04086 family)
MKKSTETVSHNPLSAMLKLTALSLFLNILVIGIYAVLITNFDLGDGGVNITSLVTIGLCCFVTGFGTAKNAKSRGLLWGVFSGIFLALILIAISYLSTQNPVFGTTQISRLVSAGAFGGLGGVLGINKN